MSMNMKNDIKSWTAKRKAVLVREIIQGKTSISEASRAFDISPSEIEEWAYCANKFQRTEHSARSQMRKLE